MIFIGYFQICIIWILTKLEQKAFYLLCFRIDPISPNSLFSTDPKLENSGDDVQKYCSCATEASNGNNPIQELPDHHAAVCNITSSLVDCSQQQTPSLFLTTCNRVGHGGRKRRALSEDGLNTRSKRVRRSTIDSDDVVDFAPISYDPAFNTSFIPPVSLWYLSVKFKKLCCLQSTLYV